MAEKTCQKTDTNQVKNHIKLSRNNIPKVVKIYAKSALKTFENVLKMQIEIVLYFSMTFSMKMLPKRVPQSALGQLLGASWRLLGGSWAPLGELLAPLGSLLEPLGAPKPVKVSKKASRRPPKGSPKGRQRQPRAVKTSQKNAKYPPAFFLPPSCHFLAMFPCFSAAPMQLKSETSELQAQSTKPEAASQTLELKAKR